MSIEFGASNGLVTVKASLIRSRPCEKKGSLPYLEGGRIALLHMYLAQSRR